MRIPRIFTSQTLVTGDSIKLDAQASRHLTKVLRMEVSRPLLLFNGEGGEYSAEIIEVGKTVCVKILEHDSIERASTLEISLVIGLSKGERFEWVLQKATELGVSHIYPLFTERSEVKLRGERLDKKLDHWRKIIVSACEQCQLNRLPTLHAPKPLFEVVNDIDADKKLVLHHRTQAQLVGQEKPGSVAILIGPEGGLSEEEISQAEQAGFDALRLGPRIFRTETAPIAAISILQFQWGDLC
ncbi:16S rRNA (uracil(1498)-N(3))-methyltransferase [Marinibactrum halimedae]|uniref:Ribosomal RNA small subunit methyltransferase E n=1 Tax=Marinibactrum halimedae TaxID=1444977 RepID=A0AA37T772_9GAMM|nr:16S rRNA (uracil(1498)-N(3))-methyltransferase [Marinibactrum halimedae]MCD9458333.1 16S rRNA (uracil(1498)-N(3))-methyltransferase [Marinibactrum halimedae]GLS27039.1 ribosomal RNA small subunit methyltransferase E [Marinibactrum halimedae]